MSTERVTFATLDLRAQLTAAVAVQRHANALSDLECSRRRKLIEIHANVPAARAFGAWAGHELVGFGYGRSLEPQWWWAIAADRQLRSNGGESILDDSFAFLELHVLPGWQRRGIGRTLLHLVCEQAREARAVLTTPVTALPAQRLYHSVGFATLLPSLSLGHNRSYAVMSARLPLHGGPDRLRPAG